LILDTPSKRRALLDGAKSVAIVGASDNPARPSYFVTRYLRTHGFEIWPVNPAHVSVDGLKSYPSLAALVAERGVPDIVDVFRRPDALPRMVEEAIAVAVKAIWFQYGVINPDAIKRADDAGLTVVVDRCMKVEHARFAGGLSMQGFDSGVLTSKRRLNV
jgi:predicted CoA-binding protein